MKILLLSIFLLLSVYGQSQAYTLGQDLQDDQKNVYGQVYEIVDIVGGQLIYVCSKETISARDWNTMKADVYQFNNAGFSDWYIPNSGDLKRLITYKNSHGQCHGWYGNLSWVWTCEDSRANQWVAYCRHLQMNREGTMFKSTPLFAIPVRMIEVKN